MPQWEINLHLCFNDWFLVAEQRSACLLAEKSSAVAPL